MHTAVFYLLLLSPLLSTIAIQNLSPYTPADLILLNCGAPNEGQSMDGRNWEGDAGHRSKYCPFNSEISSPSKASQQDSSVTPVPYMTARIYRSKFTCTFPVSMGPKFIRLYFYPTTYSGLNISTSFFSVTANDYTLLSNFSSYLTVSAMQPPVAYFVKEFIISVWDNQAVINLTFTPSPNSFAFINGIEIVSMPTNLYAKDNDYAYPFVNDNSIFNFDNTTALETVCRLNVGGGDIENVKDIGMFRPWSDDSSYLFGGLSGVVHKWRDNVTIKYSKDTPAYVAPEAVYISKRTMGTDSMLNKNYNLTWHFLVDSGFNYLLRLHFCETDEQITHEGQRVFSIFINNMTAVADADVIHWSGGNSIPVYKDYVILVPGGESHSKKDLWLALHPNTDLLASYADAILNGLEIFKLNNSDGNLAGSNPEALMVVPSSPEQQSSLQKGTKIKAPSVVVIVGVVVGVLFAFSFVLFFFILKRKGKAKDIDDIGMLLPTDLCRQFTIAEIRAATRNFEDQNIIGSGGFGTVYKGYIENEFIPVAIKRLNSTSKQGTREFHTEIEMLSKLRHIHLVSLIGYCDDQDEMVLVYDYMPHGNFQDHLYKTQNPPLPWKQRLQICIGAAKGLHYLHTGVKHTIIHRDVKSSNILLDRNWVAKVSDFGLSKTGPTGEDQTHVSTVVRGSVGYLDPEYYRRQHLTEKSDVYSFGVVLLEVLCARPPIISNLSKEQVNLVEWTRNCHRKGTFDDIIDSQLKGDITSVSLNKFVEIAESCVREKATERPKMGDVVWSLEFALQLQEFTEKNVNASDIVREELQESSMSYKEVTTTDGDDLFTFSGGTIPDSRSTISFGEKSTKNNDSDEVGLFSEIMNPQGR
ncbi:receptor-like protein kinase FERONIA [Jatropha curcas]|nr:receptor-like protein kinase FERONIA [Jatropha curcas]